MINSNYYGFDTICEIPTNKQTARAANLTWAALCFRREVEQQKITPVSLLLFLMIKYSVCEDYKKYRKALR